VISPEHGKGGLGTWGVLNGWQGEQFVYLGANIDAYKTARTFGIASEATVAYCAEETLFMMQKVAERTGGFLEARLQEVRFSAAEKHAAGDRFDKAALLRDAADTTDKDRAGGVGKLTRADRKPASFPRLGLFKQPS
jgi:hypothetical protein